MKKTDFRPKAFIFDLNGTMIDDMAYHAQAWQSITSKDLGVNFSYEKIMQEMYGKNQEVLERLFGKAHFSPDQIERLSNNKEKRYQEAYQPFLSLIDGLDVFLKAAKKNGVKMAVASAAILANIDFVLDGLQIRSYFDAIVSADDVDISKPHPETFLKAAQSLGVPPGECLVFEDAPKGVESAECAGMKCIVLTTTHNHKAFIKYKNIKNYILDYNNSDLKKLL